MSPSNFGFKFDMQAQSLANCRFLSSSRNAVFFAVTCRTPSGLYRAVIFRKDGDGESPYMASGLEPTVDRASKALHDKVAEKVNERYEAALAQESQDGFKTRTKSHDADSEDDIMMTPESESGSNFDSAASDSDPEAILRQPRRRRDNPKKMSPKSKHRASSPSLSQSMNSLADADLSSDDAGNESYRVPQTLPDPMAAPRANAMHGSSTHLPQAVPPPAMGAGTWQHNTNPLPFPGLIQISTNPQPPAQRPATHPRTLPPPPPPQPLPGSITAQQQPGGNTYLVRLHISWNGRGDARTLQHVLPFLGSVQRAALGFARTNQAAFSGGSSNNSSTTTLANSPCSQHQPLCHPLKAIVRKVRFDGESYEASALCGSLGDISKILSETSGVPAFDVEIVEGFTPSPQATTFLPAHAPVQAQHSVPPQHQPVSMPWGTQQRHF